MKVKTAKVLAFFISVLLLFASCDLLTNGGETEVTIRLPYVAGTSSRAIDPGKKDDLIEATKSYRVHINDTVLEGTGGNFSAYFMVGLKLDIYVECVNGNGEVILRTVTKSIVVRNGQNSVSFNLMADGNEVTLSTPLPIKMIPIPGKDFSMSETDITQWQWDDVMHDLNTRASPPTDQYGKGDNYPMYYLIWYETLVYCNKLSMKERLAPCYTIKNSTNPADWGDVPTARDSDWDAVQVSTSANGYRLPTDAEWEYAAKGGTKNTYGVTDIVSELKDYAWYADNSEGKTYEVKKLKPNGYGLYDIVGNVYTFIWHDSFHGARRGGSSYKGSGSFQVATSTSTLSPTELDKGSGFRVVRSQ